MRASGMERHIVPSRSGGFQAAPTQGLAMALGVSKRHVLRAAKEGLTAEKADAWACKLGLHPSNVWPEWWTDA